MRLGVRNPRVKVATTARLHPVARLAGSAEARRPPRWGRRPLRPSRRPALWAGLAAALWCAPSLGQSRPTIIDHPLEVRAGLGAEQVAALQDGFRKHLAGRTGVLVPTRTGWKITTASFPRKDCSVRDDCLRQLALLGGTLYALHTSIEVNAAGTQVTATGRVVSQDGAQVRPVMRATAPIKRSMGEAAAAALRALVSALALEKLPPVLAAPAAAPAQTTASATPDLAPPPAPPGAPPLPALPALPAAPALELAELGQQEVVSPPPLLEARTAGPQRSAGLPAVRTAAVVTAGAAAVSGALSLGLGVAASMSREQLPKDGRLLDDDQAQAQLDINRRASAALGTGLGASALAITSVVLFFVSAPAPRPSVAVGVDADGAALTVSGSF